MQQAPRSHRSTTTPKTSPDLGNHAANDKAMVLRQWLGATLLNGFPTRRTEIESWQAHTPFVSALVSLAEPKLFVELGTHKGDSYCAACETVVARGLSTRCVAVDCWQGDEHAGEYGDEVLNELRAHHDPLYSGFSRLHRAFFDEAVQTFADGEIDLLHIDGLHTEQAVRQDFETWKPKLSARAVVLFHDTQVHENDFGVYKVWAQLAENYPHFEFMHGNGLGVLAVGPQAPEAVLTLCALGANPNSQAEAKTLRNSFDVLGAAVLYKGRAKRLWQQADELWARTQIAEGELEKLREDDHAVWQRVQRAEEELNTFKQAHDAAWERIKKAEEDLQVYQSAHQEAWGRIHQVEAELDTLRERNAQLQDRHDKLFKLARPVLGLARFIARFKNGA